jgi:hypothetical protein
MLYKIIFFENQIRHASSIAHCCKIINEEITSHKMMSFPVTNNIVSNWTSRKVPLKSKKYNWVKIEKTKKL